MRYSDCNNGKKTVRYQRCTRCIMDNKSDDTISFDKDGHCNYCNDVLKRIPKEYFAKEGKKGGIRLHKIIEKIKTECANDRFDCMIGISGGIDSSYLMYLGHQYGLRMLAVHIDDGLDNPIATNNIEKLIRATDSKYIVIKPDIKQYADVLYALIKASVSNLAICQDNMIFKAIKDYGQRHHIKYILDGRNFAHECILERNSKSVNSSDSKYIKAVHRRYGRISINDLEFMALTERYIGQRANRQCKNVRLLNYIDYNLEDALNTLESFCGFEYYGGKHYESILTRFMQCYYLPVKFGIDKRKSHFSSLIMTNQLTREEALKYLEKPLYISNEMLEEDKKFIADYIEVSVKELDDMIAQPPKAETEYPHSILNELAPLARKFRKVLE